MARINKGDALDLFRDYTTVGHLTLKFEAATCLQQIKQKALLTSLSKLKKKYDGSNSARRRELIKEPFLVSTSAPIIQAINDPSLFEGLALLSDVAVNGVDGDASNSTVEPTLSPQLGGTSRHFQATSPRVDPTSEQLKSKTKKYKTLYETNRNLVRKHKRLTSKVIKPVIMSSPRKAPLPTQNKPVCSSKCFNIEAQNGRLKATVSQLNRDLHNMQAELKSLEGRHEVAQAKAATSSAKSKQIAVLKDRLDYLEMRASETRKICCYDRKAYTPECVMCKPSYENGSK